MSTPLPPIPAARRSGALPAWTVTTVLALLWLAFAPRTPDLAAQVYRTTLFAREGSEIWDDFWFSGHHLPA